MTEFERLLGRVSFGDLMTTRPGHEPLGAAWLAEDRRGMDLDAYGYVEQECLFSGWADEFTWDEGFKPIVAGTHPFTSRVIVRRPADPARFSGAVQLEPLHPDDDQPLSWGNIAPWIVAEGHAHVGVTQDSRIVAELIEFDAERYGDVMIAAAEQRWDIVGLVAAALKTGLVPAFGEMPVERIVMSGWSNTGTFCRSFLGEGFHDRCRVEAKPAVDGYVICISSGGAARSGYASLRDGALLPAGDPRRTIGAHGVPVVELLSECESETQGPVLRDDSDGPQDMYRLYQVAGTGHITTGVRSLLTNRWQKRRRGMPAPPREINEQPSDARMDMVARAVYDCVDRWIADGVAPARAERFSYVDPDSPAPRGLMPGSIPLARDVDGNVLGGLRTPWVEVPRAAYLPHSTPRPGSCEPGPNAPFRDPAIMADLIGHARPIAPEELRRRYGSTAMYLERFEQAAREAAGIGSLREVELPELVGATRRSCDEW